MFNLVEKNWKSEALNFVYLRNTSDPKKEVLKNTSEADLEN